MALDASSARERVEQLIVLTERLTAMMRQETEAFEAHRPADALAGADETARLANLYRHESLKIRRDPALITNADPKLRRRLMDATKVFDAALQRHGRAVKAAKTITEGLVRAMAEEVVRLKDSGAGYSANAKAAEGDATSITLNRRA